jgi:hypothetical protein
MKKDKNIKNWNQFSENLILESRLSRMIEHMTNGKPFGMVSLSRSTMSKGEKNDAFSKLKEMVREMGYGFIELKGGYVEKGETIETDSDIPVRYDDGVDVIDELSLMIPNLTLTDGIKIGTTDLGHGPQDSILYCDGDSFLGYIITNNRMGKIGDVDMEFDYSKDVDFTKSIMGVVEKYFSMLAKGSHRGRKFSFVAKSEEVPDLATEKDLEGEVGKEIDSEKNKKKEFRLYEMESRRSPKYPERDWWYNFGKRIM